MTQKSQLSRSPLSRSLLRRSLLWITDPWSTLDHPKDTTLRLIQEGFFLGASQFWCDLHSIRLITDPKTDVWIDCKKVLSVSRDRTASGFEWGPTETRSLSEFTQIHYRPDPPIDLHYLHPLHLISLGTRKRRNCEIVNPLKVLLLRNEKLEATTLRNLMPPSVVSSQWEPLREFGKKYPRTVLKPLHQAQSQGIELLNWNTPDDTQISQSKIKKATQHYQIPILLQSYLEGIEEGETRLWWVDGRLIANIKKLPLRGDFRVNIDRGSPLAAARLTSSEKKTLPQLSRHLKSHQIRLAAIDLIDGWVTDFNFTSPGLITQMESILSENLAKAILVQLLKG